jgi:hypothetical protein
MDVSITPSDVIATVALLISAYVAWHQRGINASQKKVNELLLQQGETEAQAIRKADLGASFLKLGKNNYRLKIWNKGKATARNIRIDFPDGNQFVVKSDVSRKFPLEALEQFQSVEVMAYMTLGTDGKHHVRLTWDDESGKDIEKSVYVTV